jgi:hypothetical protein
VVTLAAAFNYRRQDEVSRPQQAPAAGTLGRRLWKEC